MGVIVKQGFRSTVIIYAGAALGALNLLWIFPKFLKPDEIGLIRVLLEMGTLYAVLSQFGLPQVADKFFSYFNNEKERHQGFLFLLFLYSTIGFLAITIVYFITHHWWIQFYQEKSPFLIHYLYSIIPLAMFIMYSSILESYCRVHLKIVIPSLIREVFLRIAQAAVVILYFYDLISLDTLVYLTIATYLAGLLLMVLYVKKENRLYLTRLNYPEKKELIKEMVLFGLFLYLGGASAIIATKIDVMMLSSYAGLFSTGVYSIAFFIGTVIEIPKRPISAISSPLIAHFWRLGDMVQIKDLYRKSAVNQLFIGLALFLLIWGNVDHLLSLIPNSEIYKAGKYVILFIGLSKLFDMGTGVNSEIITNSPFYKINFFLGILSGILIIGLNYILIPWLKIDGAALAILLNYIVLNSIRMVIVLFKMKMHPFSPSMLYMFLTAVATYVMILLIPEVHGAGIWVNLLNIFVKSGIIAILFGGSVYYFNLAPEINAVIARFLKLRK